MGSFFGHALPGSFFIICGIWWTIQTYRRYYKTLQKGKNGYFNSSVTFPIFTKRGWIDIESYVFMICCALGMIVELVLATIKNGHLGTGNIQHGTMYFFFGLTSFSAVILPKIPILPMYEGIVYLILSLSFFTEGILFKFHLFGRSGLDVVVHTLLVFTIFASALITLFEMKNRKNVLLPLSRAFLTILQGSWFWQVAFILYPPMSNPWGGKDVHREVGDNKEMEKPHEDHNLIMFSTCVFAWHMAVILIMMILIGMCIGLYYKRSLGLYFDQTNSNCHEQIENPVYNGDYTSVQQRLLEDEDV